MVRNMSAYRVKGWDVVENLGESWLLKIGVFGLLLIVLGTILQSGVVAGLIVIYGLGFLVFGFGGYAGMTIYKRLWWERDAVGD